jgi:hypothetical protein
VDEAGLLSALSRIHCARNAIDPERRLRLYSVPALSPKEHWIRDLRAKGQRHREPLLDRQLPRGMHGRSDLEDLYIYRLN